MKINSQVSDLTKEIARHLDRSLYNTTSTSNDTSWAKTSITASEVVDMIDKFMTEIKENDPFYDSIVVPDPDDPNAVYVIDKSRLRKMLDPIPMKPYWYDLK